MTTFFVSSKPVSIRIWHWLTFLFFSCSIVTVVLGSTLFKTRNNIDLVIEQVKEKGGTVTKDQARNVAHEFSDKLWMLHKYIGFGLAFLIFWRIGIELKLAAENKLRNKLKSAAAVAQSNEEARHYLNVHRSYLIFYILFLLMALTGLVLAFEEVSFLDPVHKPSKVLHGYIQYGLYAYMLLHIVAVIRADLTRYPGIVSRMINGKNA